MDTDFLTALFRWARWVLGASLGVLVTTGSVRGQATQIVPWTIYPVFDSSEENVAPEVDLLHNLLQPPDKSAYAGQPNQPNQAGQGGDTFENARVITGLPYTDTGTTTGYADNYVESCIAFRGSPDVVYSYTPTNDVVVDVSLCGSSYDTYAHIYVNAYAPGAPYKCNDDYCALSSQINSVTMTAGNTYFIVVDGFGGNFGEYKLSASVHTPPPPSCNFVCPPGALPEGELCVTGGTDTVNRGCFSDIPRFSLISSGDTICGSTFSGPVTADSPDIDWYRKSFAGDTTAIWNTVANFPVYLIIIRMNTGCTDFVWIKTVSAAACDTASLSADLEAGTYAFVVVNAAFDNTYSCETGPWNYVAWLTCQDPPPIPANDECANATPIGDVTKLPFTTRGATHDTSTCTSHPNIWYCYTAPADGTLRMTVCPTGYTSRVAVYDGCGCPTGTPLICRNNPCSPPSRISLPVAANQTYLIEIASADGVVGPGVLNVQYLPFPPNNFCEDVTPVPLPATFTGDNTGAVNQCDTLSRGHTWHAFTIDECMDVTLDYCGTSPAFRNGWEVLVVGCPCDSFVIAESWEWNSCGDGNVTLFWPALGPGTYYYPMLVDPGRNAEGPYTLHITGIPVPAACRYCRARGICESSTMRITSVSLSGTSTNSACERYGDFTATEILLWKGLQYEVTVSNGNPIAGARCGVWFDWNRDLDFLDEGENVMLSGSPGGAVFAAPFALPQSPGTDTTTMRVVLSYEGTLAPCGTDFAGEAEDYTLILKHFDCGDWNDDGLINQTDIQAITNYYFNNAACPEPCEVADVTCDGTSNLADILYLIKYVYGDGPPPCCGP